MVVLASSICNKSGKAIIARQFIEMAKSRIEGLLASFPKLISAGHQHTFVETDSVRYIYQPLDDLYLVLITNKSSNILQDIDTLHLFARTISEFCRSMKESEIVSKAFDLLIAFDEIISLGYRENISVAQIKTNCEMESHEEKLQEMLQKSKEREAIEAAKLKAKQLEVQKREMQKRGLASGLSSASGGSSGGFGSFGSVRSPSSYSAPQSASVNSSNSISASPFNANPPAAAPKGGMQLGGKPKISNMLDAIRTEEGLPEFEQQLQHMPVSSSNLQQQQHQQQQLKSPNQAAPAVNYGKIHAAVDEKLLAAVNRDGGLDSMEVKGELLLRVADAAHAKAKLILTYPPADASSLQFKTHPHVDKNAWTAESSIAPKDPNKPFPINQPVPVLKWRHVSKDESILPFTISFWPVPSGGTIDCTVEFELTRTEFEFKNVLVSIPIASGSPKVDHVDGEYFLNPSHKTLDWNIPLMDADNSSGTLEFSVGGDDVNSMFPVVISFSTPKSFIGIDVASAHVAGSSDNVDFTKEIKLSTEDYRIV